jgi:hypothetical protein
MLARRGDIGSDANNNGGEGSGGEGSGSGGDINSNGGNGGVGSGNSVDSSLLPRPPPPITSFPKPDRLGDRVRSLCTLIFHRVEASGSFMANRTGGGSDDAVRAFAKLMARTNRERRAPVSADDAKSKFAALMGGGNKGKGTGGAFKGRRESAVEGADRFGGLLSSKLQKLQQQQQREGKG